jgi:hypothetical protein
MLGAADMPIGCALKFSRRATNPGEKIKAGEYPAFML